MKYRYKKTISFLLILTIIFSFCGFESESGITEDFGEQKIYKSVVFDSIASQIAVSKDTARTKYDGAYCQVLAHVNSIDSDLTRITVTQINTSLNAGSKTTVKCIIADSDVKNQLVNINTGQNVYIYCKVNIGTFEALKLSEIKGIQVTDDLEVSDNTYALVDGSTYCSDDYTEKNIANKFKYKIPKSWEAIENPLPAVGDYAINGYCYRLNQNPDNPSISSENLYVFYFNKILLKTPNSNFKNKQVEQAIINNILGQDGADIKSNRRTSYDTTFDYYFGNYNTHNNNYAHHVEFVFLPLDKNEFCVVMYTFKVSEHADDVIFFLKDIKKN